MKKITLFTKAFFTIRITQNFYQTKTKETVQRLLSVFALRLAVMLLLLGGVSQVNAQTLLTTSFEDNTVNSWASASGANVAMNGTNARTGTYCLNDYWTSTGTRQVKSGNASLGTASNYIHVILWAKATTAENFGGSATALQLYKSSATGTKAMSVTTSYQRFYTSATGATGAYNVRIGGNVSNATNNVYIDDVIFYEGSSATTDLTDPSVATTATGTTTGLTWINGTDTGTGATGLQATLIFKRTAGTVGSNDLSLNSQGIYSLTATQGPSVVGNWTLQNAAVSSGATSYAGSFTGGEEYAIVHRDLAYNYSSPTYVVIASGPEMNVRGGFTSTDIADNDAIPTTTDDTDFGSILESAGTIVKTFTIQNTGTATLNINSITIGGTNASDFTVTTNPSPTTILAGGSTTFSVTFDPSAVALQTATISIANNDANESTYNFSIQGTGTAACPTYSLSTIAIATTPICAGTAATVNLTGLPANLPAGSYTVTYDLDGTNTATVQTATMNVDATGNGSFTTIPLATAGDTDIIVTNLASGSCSSTISGVTTSVTAAVIPTITGTTPFSRSGTGTVTLGATASTGTISWFANPTGGIALGTGASYTTPSISSTTTYYVETIDGPCKSTPRTAVVATVTGVTAPEINIQGNSNDILDGAAGTSTTNNTNFGSINVSVPVTKTFTIQNTGTAALSITGISLSDTTNYSLSAAAFPFSINANSSATFTVTYTPGTIATHPATLTITNTDSTEATYDFPITGTGVAASAAPEIEVQGGDTLRSISSGDDKPSANDGTDFGFVNNGVVTTRTFTILNTGTATLNITGAITFSGNNASNFSASVPSSTAIAPGGSATFVVTLTPNSTGVRNTNIVIPNNDATGGENSYTFAIQGTSNSQEINVTGGSGPSNINDGDSSPTIAKGTDFGSTAVTTGSVENTFTIESTGNSNTYITVGAITFTGANPTDFTVTAIPTTTVTGQTSTTFKVTFTPSGAGLRKATISIVNNDTGENPYNFDLQGTGAASTPEINIQGNSNNISDNATGTSTSNNTDFGSTPIGTPISRTFTIQNTGTIPLNIGTITLGDTANYSITTLPAATVPASGTTTFTVRFNPTAGIDYPTTISIVTDDSNENPYNFAIKGTGSGTPEMNIQGNGNDIADTNNTTYLVTNRTDFGTTSVGTPVTYTYTIQNTGNGILTLGTATLSDLTNFSFTLPPSSINPGATATFNIIYKPKTNGTHTATFSIVTNDGDENPYNFNVKGIGTTAPEIDILGNATSITDGSTTPVLTNWTDFGSADYLSETITKTFTIKNIGNADLTLTSISLSGSADFSITSKPTNNSTLAAGASATLVIALNPAALGIKNATITVISNDTNEATYDFAIQGFGIQTFYDSDGDGVDDNMDIDDDNDGILDATEDANCTAANGSQSKYKFLSETFGTGGRTTINTTYAAETNYCFESGNIEANTGTCPDLDDWSLNDGEYTVGPSAQIATWAAPLKWYAGEDHTPGDTSGRMAIFNAATTPGVFYTANITGALPSLPITYSFWVLNLDRLSHPDTGRTLPDITIEFRNATTNALIASYSTGGIPRCAATPSATDWHQFTNPITLGVSAFKILFINNAAGGSGNDLAIDDISITQSLCNYDNDDIADMFDLDSDNDGIPDVVEAGLGQYSDGTGKMTGGTIGADGLNSNAIAASLSTTLNSDGDTLPNTLDLDSDNDSVFDVDEAGTANINAPAGYVNGDGDITGDGFGEGLDSEAFRSKDSDGNGTIEFFGDGILDIFDYDGTGTSFSDQYGNLDQGTATALPATTYLKDTDGDGIPDYLDIYNNTTGIYDIANNKLIYASIKDIDPDNNGVVGVVGANTDADTDGILDAFDTNTAVKGSPRDLYNNKLLLRFDGRNDYAESTAILGGLSNATLMAWIDLNTAFSADGVIVGQDNFQIRINSALKLEAVVNGGTALTYGTALTKQQWYNVAAVFGGGTLKLYLNGALLASQAAPANISTDTSLLTIGRNPSASNKFFNGKIDEVRVFNCALTDSQLQRMVYQEIKSFGSEIRGEIVPKNVATSPTSLPFANLLRYYRMDSYKDDIIDDLTTPAIDVTGTKIYNHKIIQLQEAPMPFLTERAGNFATAVNSPTKEIRGMDIMNQDWSIVKVQHDITETSNNIDLGMIVDPGKNIVMNNDTKIHNDWYLKLDGKIDLVGKSQLLQTIESDLDVTSAGSIERDQQGQSNKYNYNYWSSPVNPINTTANNTDYTVASVMKDGTTATPQNITWIGGYDGSAATSPISLARYWLYKFDSAEGIYANWQQFTEGVTLSVGKGYTLKGSGAASTTQNYTFVGKPNNGTIINTVGPSELLLVGNPYPSAIDSDEFIKDNIKIDQTETTTDGTLYFWQHAPENDTHILANYLGSYGVLNKVGGIPPFYSIPTNPLIIGGGSANRIPSRYIPVGQGFFVYGSASGGDVVFKNSQRAFVKEDNAASNSLFKTKATTKTAKDSNNDDVAVSPYKKIRLGYNTANGYHRQVLLAFMDEEATSGIDIGYDGEMLDDFPNDMSLLKDETQLVIEGEGYFDVNATYPIGVKSDIDGKVSFIIDGIENFDAQQPIYIHDNLTDTYHDIREGKLEIDLPSTSSTSLNNRFSLRFKDKTLVDETLGVNKNDIANENALTVSHIQKGNILEINNQLVDTTIEKVTLFNMLGQSIASWKTENPEQQNIQIPLKSVSSGVYITKIKTSKGDVSKKVIIK